MSKIICGICGTQYSDASESCPICGTSRDYRSAFSENEEFCDVSIREEPAPVKKQIFDFDEVNQETEQETFEEEYEQEYYEESSESNTAVVVILVILIALLLMAIGFIFFRFLLPNIVGPEETVPVVTTIPVETETVATEPEETAEPTIPCTDLAIPGGKVELGQKGQFWLLNVQVFPQNTTDTLTFSSEDENIAVVDKDGRVTAVGEGKTAIHILCGNVKLKCTVTVDFSLEADPADEEILPTLSVDETQENVQPDETEPSEETAATQETTAPVSPDAVLKLKKTDITLSVRYGSYQMELDCDIPPEEIQWMTMDSTKAIVINGLITATGPGTTTIKATYKGQVAQCIVRCNFS